MSIALSDRIEMPESTEVTLDDLFEWIERTPFSEGYKVEVVEGTVYMAPQRFDHWNTILKIIRQLLAKHDDERLASDVLFEFPGELNGLCPDIALLAKEARRDGRGRWRCEDVVFVAEVISQGTGQKDYGPKKAVYAYTGVPAYLIVDPYQRRCHLYTEPTKDEDRRQSGYEVEMIVRYGTPVDLRQTPAGIMLATDRFLHS